MSNIPDIPATNRYFGLFTDRDIDRAFIDFLYGNHYLMTPGAYWMSGSELAAVSNIVTDLLPNWRPADPQDGPAHMVRGGI